MSVNTVLRKTIEICVTRPRKILGFLPIPKYIHDTFYNLECDDLEDLYRQIEQYRNSFEKMYPNAKVTIYDRTMIGN